MEGSHFDEFTRSLTKSRRALLGGALASATGLLGVSRIDARKKRKRKKRHKKTKSQPQPQPQPQPNDYGCLDVGKACDGDSSRCCSGICEGTGATSRCVAHNELGCDADDETCSESVPCGADGICYRTTGKAGFCASRGICRCGPCQKDTDCEADYGPGAACIVCTGDCAGVNRSQGTACVAAAA